MTAVANSPAIGMMTLGFEGDVPGASEEEVRIGVVAQADADAIDQEFDGPAGTSAHAGSSEQTDSRVAALNETLEHEQEITDELGDANDALTNAGNVANQVKALLEAGPPATNTETLQPVSQPAVVQQVAPGLDFSQSLPAVVMTVIAIYMAIQRNMSGGN